MSKKYAFIFIIVCGIHTAYGQTVQDIIDMVDVNRLEQIVAELADKQPTMINGTMQTINTRVFSNNDLTADYLEERFLELNNIAVEVQNFNTSGKNIIATQLGQTNPDDIYIICAHYDSVTEYGADDNATGVAAVLEIARILSTQCTENTIIYAIWDEEEIGLRGAEYYANLAADTSNGNTRDNILGVLNIDMIGYDGDAPGTAGDNDFDIDVRNIAGSIAMKDDILDLLSTYTFDLNPIIVDPGTPLGDHERFWNRGYSAVLLGESWETGDQSPFYHTVDDKLATLDMQYFHELTKLAAAYMATESVLVSVDNTVVQNTTMLTSNDSSGSYQWFNCDTDLLITGATNQSFTPTTSGNYAVEVTSGSCTERSACFSFTVLSTETFTEDDVKVFPNPVITILNVAHTLSSELILQIHDIEGKRISEMTTAEPLIAIDMSDYASGIYFLKAASGEKERTYKLVKE